MYYANIKNSSNEDLVVLDSYSTTDTNGNSVDQLKVLNNNRDQSQTIKASTNGEVTLDDTYIDPDTKQPVPSLVYRLILSSSASLFPLGVEVADFILSDDAANLELTQANVNSTKLAAQFIMAISAYPNSNLAQNFRSILDRASKSTKSADNVEKKINAFFKSTKDYTTVTFSDYNVVSTYFNEFPFVWANYKSSKIYYLYSSDGKNQLKEEGTLTLTRNSTAIPNPTDSSGGYQILYKDTDSKVTNLSYSNGQFISNLNADIPDIVLSGTYELKSRITAKPSDNQVITILTGSLYGKTIIGLDTKQDTSSGAEPYWKTLLEPKGAQQIIQSIMILSGLLMFAVFVGSGIYKGIMFAKGRLSGGKKPTETEVTKVRERNVEEAKQNFDDYCQKNSAGKEKTPENTEEIQNVAEDSMEQQLGWSSKASIEITLEIEDVRLRIIIENTNPTVEMETAASKLKNINEQLESATPENITQVVAEQSTAIKTASQDITKVQREVEQEVNQEVKQKLEDQEQASEDATTDLDKQNDTADDTNNGSDDGSDDEFFDAQD